MKIKGVVITGLVLAMISTTAIFASATTYHTVTVKKASTTAGVTNLNLSGLPSQTTLGQWCTVASASNDTALAIALTAISLNMQIRIGLADDYVAATATTAGTCNLTQVGLEN